MTREQALERAVSAARHVRVARLSLQVTTTRRDDALRAAVKAGCSGRELARATSLTAARISQIIHG